MAKKVLILLAMGIVLALAAREILAEMEPPPENPLKGPVRADLAAPNTANRVHRVGNLWMNITNWGFFGNYSIWGGLGMDDPEYPGTWAPQCEYPANSDIQYLFQGALWLGAMVQEEGYEFPRVSTGTDGWVRPRINEFYPGEEDAGGIEERSSRPNAWNRLGEYVTHPNAISEQDFVLTYTDTLKENFYVAEDPIDGPHFPLGIKITQKSYAWSYNYAQNFIIIDWEIENIAGNYLKNLYIGLYIDADVGWEGEATAWYPDDICGFQKYFYYDLPNGGQDSSLINTAWIADNDGRPVGVESGNEFTCPSVTGVRVVRAPNPKLQTSFNWWISEVDPDLDFGPAWKDDGSPGGWTDVYGTPMGDVKKYFILSNREFDYDQVYTRDAEYLGIHPQEFRDRWAPDFVLESHDWKVAGVDDETPSDYVDNLANGFDTRYLLSWGPLGIFDHIDEAGNRIYRLNPGEKFTMTVAYVAGDNFHERGDPQPDAQVLIPSKYSFTSLRYNADWAARVYDNPMIDTPTHDWGSDGMQGSHDADGSEGDGALDTGDGWYGEDTGEDGLYALERGMMAYYWSGKNRQTSVYPGPDPGENDGHLSPFEDGQERPEEFEYTRMNGQLDFGDGIPDFQGPPPPPAPVVTLLTEPVTLHRGGNTLVIDEEKLKRWVILTWNKMPSEAAEYLDPFSRERDFEGYRVYTSNTGLERDFSFMDEFDQIDWSLYSATDSLAWQPVLIESHLPADTTISGVHLTRKPVGRNIGLGGSGDLYYDDDTENYYYVLPDAHPMMPRYYAVTAYDYGDYKTGTPPLESAKRSNMIYAAPSGTNRQKVMVVPNPYRASQDYTLQHGDGLSWENRDDGTPDFFPQTDRRIYFYNLPRKCFIRIYTIAGDLVQTIPHLSPELNQDYTSEEIRQFGDLNSGWGAEFAEAWDLNSRNRQQVVAGLYLFTIEDLTEGGDGDIEVGKFVIIR